MSRLSISASTSSWVLADEPMLFHTGPRSSFTQVLAAVSRILDPADLRWISFGHVEADECGALNRWLARAPRATVAFLSLGCLVSVDDLADRSPRQLSEADALDLGGRRVRLVATPHAPHNWESQVMFEETTATLFCGDLGAQTGRERAVTQEAGRLVEAALATEEALGPSTPGTLVPDTLRCLAALRPSTLAIMHGSSFAGDGSAVLRDLASRWDTTLASALPADRSTTTNIADRLAPARFRSR